MIRFPDKKNTILIILTLTALISGCTSSGRIGSRTKDVILSTGVTLMERHAFESSKNINEFTKRLYARNPKYEQDIELREKKIREISECTLTKSDTENSLSSEKLLTAAFEPNNKDDRVYLLCIGMMKSIREAYYGIDNSITVLQIPEERLRRLHTNLSHVKWKLKVARDNEGKLMFLTNGMGENGYLNMGYEVIQIRILTRIEDDIFLRGGMTGKQIFDISTLFLSILI